MLREMTFMCASVVATKVFCPAEELSKLVLAWNVMMGLNEGFSPCFCCDQLHCDRHSGRECVVCEEPFCDEYNVNLLLMSAACMSPSTSLYMGNNACMA